MDDEAFLRTRHRIRLSYYHWCKIFDYRPWNVTLEFDRAFPVVPAGSEVVYFHTTFNWGYLFATIRCNMPEIAALSDEDLDRCLAHELVHPLLGEITDSKRHRGAHGRSHIERVVTVLTTVLVQARKYGQYGVLTVVEPGMKLPPDETA